MKQTEHEVLFDHFLSEQLGFWLRHSPEVPLPLPVFYNLLSSETAVCFDEHLYSEDIACGPWEKELKELFRIGKLRVLSRNFDKKDDIQISLFVMPNLELKPLGRFEDTLSLIWCARQNVPFRLSERASEHLNYAIERIVPFLEPNNPPVDNMASRINAYLKWIVDVEVPELERRSEPQREETFRKNFIVAQDNPNMTHLLAQSFWESIENSLFITPPELLDLLKQKDQLQALREMVSCAANMDLTEPGVRSLLREHWDSLLGRLEIADIVFTGLDVALIPLQLPGLVTKPIQLAVNHFIRKHANWLLSLNSFNRQLRKSQKEKR